MFRLRPFFISLFLLVIGAIGCQPAIQPTPDVPTLMPIAVVGAETAVSAPLSTLPATNTPAATPVSSPIITLPATNTPIPTNTPFPTPTLKPTAYPFPTLDSTLPTPETAVPTPVIPFPKPPEIINIALLGNDVNEPQGGRTDSIIIVSINKETETATMLSLPRDLYVVIPGWTMNRINTALPHGYGVDYPGEGFGLLHDTVLYNLGIQLDYYARIGFDAFKQIVDEIGGVEIVSNCTLTDWRLISPELDPTVEENWELFTLEPGVHQMDGDLALWYARSRRTTSDFERGRRQQQVLQAIFNQGVDLNLLADLPDFWDIYRNAVETNMGLPLMVELAALAPGVRQNGVQHLSLAPAVRAWAVPETGASVQLLQWEAAQPVLARLQQPPILNRSTNPPITVEVVTNDYILYQQTAENLTWHGFVPSYAERGSTPFPDQTFITYFAPNLKGSYSWLLTWLFRQESEQIELASPAASSFNYRVVLGGDYNPCLPQLEAPLSE